MAASTTSKIILKKSTFYSVNEFLQQRINVINSQINDWKILTLDGAEKDKKSICIVKIIQRCEYITLFAIDFRKTKRKYMQFDLEQQQICFQKL